MLYDHAKFEIPLGAEWPSPVATVQESHLLKAIARRANGINIFKAEIGYFEQTGNASTPVSLPISFMQDGCISMTKFKASSPLWEMDRAT